MSRKVHPETCDSVKVSPKDFEVLLNASEKAALNVRASLSDVKKGDPRNDLNLDMTTEDVKTKTTSRRNLTAELYYGRIALIIEYYQTLGIILANIPIPDGYLDGIRDVLASIAILDVKSLVNSDAAITASFWVVEILSIFFILGLAYYYSAKAPRGAEDGLSQKTWIERKSSERFFATFSLRLLILYMFTVISNHFFNVIRCNLTVHSASEVKMCNLYFGNFVGQIAACLGAAFITVPVPIFSAFIALRYRPDKRTSSEDGKELSAKEVDDCYKEDLSRDMCPFFLLYCGYRRKWAAYRALTMLFILSRLFVLMLFACISTPLYSMVAVIAVDLISFMVLVFGRPHNSDATNRYLDIYQKTAQLLKSGLLAITQALTGPTPRVLSVLVQILLATVIAAQVAALLNHPNVIKLFFEVTSTVELSRGKKSRLEALDPHASPTALQQMLWQAFWKSLFFSAPELKPPENKLWTWSTDEHRPPYLQHFQGSPAERLEECLEIVRESNDQGQAYLRALKSPNVADKERVIIKGELMGYDVAYQLATGGQGWGAMYAVTFPFTVVIAPDAEGDCIVLNRQEDIQRFISLNQSDDIQHKCRLRREIRCLSHSPMDVHFEHSEMRTLSYTDSENNPRRVNVRVYFSNGKLRVALNRDEPKFPPNSKKAIVLSAGFRVNISYSDGEAHYDGHSWHRETKTLEGKDIGIYPDFQENDKIKRLLDDVGNRKIIDGMYAEYDGYLQEYRDFFLHEEEWKFQVLRYDFWPQVFTNYTQSRVSLERNLNTYNDQSLLLPENGSQGASERTANPVGQIPSAHRPELDFLYHRQRYILSNPVALAWFQLFREIWMKNHSRGFLKNHIVRVMFDPNEPSALCYMPMPQTELRSVLRRHGLQKSNGKGLFSDKLLNQIYSELRMCATHGHYHEADIPHPLEVRRATPVLRLASLDEQTE